MSYWRNIYAYDDEESAWAEACSVFPNKVPRFTSSDDCIQFTKRYCRTGSNPIESQLFHSISTLTDWDQITHALLPKIKEYRRKWPYKQTSATTTSSSTSPNHMHEYVDSRLSLPIHSFICSYSVENTLKYLFYHMRCGIYVMIRNNQVAIFAPFVNKNYVNTWGDSLQVEQDNVEAYYMEKLKHFRDENFLSDMSKWWANGNIMCNVEADGVERTGCRYWGDQFNFQVKDMLAETCRLRDVPDCEFFINKRDYPHLKYHSAGDGSGYPAEPYGFVFDKDDRDPAADIPLEEHCYQSYAPILSFYTSQRFADIPIPPSEDWEAATGEMFPVTFAHVEEDGGIKVQPPRELFTKKNLMKFDCTWESKVNTAFFRGTATGGGVTVSTNQRLHLAALSHQWSKRNEDVPKLDAMITGWNPRDKKIAGTKMTFIRPDQFEFKGGKENFVEIYKQSSYKYLIYAEGHCAACRYGFMMLLGSVILKVESRCVADQLWYFPMLKPYYDHVPVKADLSDLEEAIDWCRAHDDECRAIAANAKRLYDTYISRDGILDYMSNIFRGIAARWKEPPQWASHPPEARQPPRRPSGYHARYNECCNDGLCGYCLEVSRQKSASADAAPVVVHALKTAEEVKKDKDAETQRLKEWRRNKVEERKQGTNKKPKTSAET